MYKHFNGLKVDKNGVIYTRKTDEPIKPYKSNSQYGYFNYYKESDDDKSKYMNKIVRYDHAVAIAWYGRDIMKNEKVVHIDGDVDNNHPLNLIIVPKDTPTPIYRSREFYLKSIIIFLDPQEHDYPEENRKLLEDYYEKEIFPWICIRNYYKTLK